MPTSPRRPATTHVPVVDTAARIEADPTPGDLARALRVEVADPAWLLGRQWQLGEHRGEDASSPVRVVVRGRHDPLTAPEPSPLGQPTTTPAEALVEAAPDDHWTPGVRIRAGQRVARAAVRAGQPLPDDPNLRATGLPVPYDGLDGKVFDGQALWSARADLGIAKHWFDPWRPPSEPAVDHWNAAAFDYTADFPVSGTALRVDRHDGGDLDWYHADATTAVVSVPNQEPAVEVLPSHLAVPGAPTLRWWTIEDAARDLGALAPERSHLATTVLLDVLSGLSNDWFTIPIEARSGHLLTLVEVAVIDAFGDHWTLEVPSDWHLFATERLSSRSLAVWASVGHALRGPVLDEVLLGVDEDANVVWAVEQRVGGRSTAPPSVENAAPPDQVDVHQELSYRYLPGTPVPRHWHPYVLQVEDGQRRYVQGRAADLEGIEARLRPLPATPLLPHASPDGAAVVHHIDPVALPPTGLRLERRTMLTRRTDASPVLWTQRRRLPSAAPPAWPLRFDVMDAAPRSSADTSDGDAPDGDDENN